MIELFIDGKRCDIDAIPTLPIDFSADKLTNAESDRVGRSIEVELPTTPCNDSIFGASRDLYATSRFNATHHIATVRHDGIAIFEGTAYLLSTTVKSDLGGGYKIRIREGGAEWVEQLAKGYLGDLEIPFNKSLDLATIADSWREEECVRFLPVYRGDYYLRYSSDAVLPVERVMLTDDYHPFISVAEMVKAMFANTGYTLHSNFLDSEFGRSLYVSGDYTRSDASRAKELCDFFAGRTSSVSATADFAGRVYASKSFATHSVGAIVDTADPTAVNSSGVQMSQTFSTNGSFSKNDIGNICFTPKHSVKAGFMLHLEYTTDYKILSRDNFVGFDVVEGLDGVRVEFPLANTCKDKRNSLLPNRQYRAIVFDHIEGRQYKILVEHASNPNQILWQWASRSVILTTPSIAIGNARIFYRDNSEDSWSSYNGDWALYDGYIEEEGRIDVEMDLRLPPQDISAGESFVLDKFWFGGAEQGMEITIGEGTTLRPYFTTVPGYGSQLSFADIVPRQTRQLELLSAVGEMFNLVFYTDRVRKEVYIEPLEEFYRGGEVVDWSSRIDCLCGVEVADRGLDTPQEILLSYIDADYASHLYNLENETTLGCKQLLNPLYGTKESVRRVGNKMFTTTLNTTEIVACAPSASIMQVGDSEGVGMGIDEPFTPHIVCYKGLRPLPEGECWIANEKQENYPYATFVDDEGTNLCFDKMGDTEGLYRYYADHFARLCESQNITVELHLTTAEIASLFTADGAKPSLRSRFRFEIEGESAIFRLAKVERWNIESDVVQCTFERELKG